jgi:hypothetical protein
MLPGAGKVACVVLVCAALAALTGCAACGICAPRTPVAKAPAPAPCDPCAAPAGELAAALPPNAKPGECYAKVYIPPEYKTVAERVMVREAYEQLEVVPAQYEWVEERVCVKDASQELQVAPAEFATREQTFEVQPATTEWEVNKNARCVAYPNQPARDIFCLVSHPSMEKTVKSQCLAKPAGVQAVTIPAEYQTVRRQKLVCPATTRKVCVPAEYTDIQKTVKVCDARIAWKLVNCDGNEPGAVGATVTPPPAQLPDTAYVTQTRAR